METERINEGNQAIAAAMINFNDEIESFGEKVKELEALKGVKKGKKYGKLNIKLFQIVNAFTTVIEKEGPIVDKETRDGIDGIGLSIGIMAGSETKPDPDAITDLVEKLKLIGSASEVLGIKIADIGNSFTGFPKQDWLDKEMAKMADYSNKLKSLAEYVMQTIKEIEEVYNETDSE